MLSPTQTFALLINISLIENPHCPKAIILSDKITEIGREAKIRVDTLRKREVSKIHATITRIHSNGKTKWVIQDNDTMNGTFVNRTKIKKHVLANGDEVVFGGGQGFKVGDRLENTKKSDTKFVFLEPLPSVSIEEPVSIDEVIPDEDNAEACPICYNPLLKRIILPCKHCLCSACLKVWVAKCFDDKKGVICPTCKTPFRDDDLLSGDFIFRGETLVVQSLDPLLRKIGMFSGKEIQSYSISNKLDSTQKKKLMEAIPKLLKKPNRIYIFLALTNCMYSQIVKMSPEMLANVVDNFDGDSDLDMPELLNEALYLVYDNIYKTF